MINEAVKYARLGLRVFPIEPGCKAPPLTRHGCTDGTTDVQTIIKWWTKTPNANIGLSCGNGIYVVDVDVDQEKGINGWESLKAFPELPKTARQDTPRGGAHFIFKSDVAPRNQNGFRTGIDIRSDGYYIVLSPSKSTEFKKSYKWADGLRIENTALAEYPDFLRPAEQTYVAPTPVQQVARQASNQTSVIERAREYLSKCEPSVSGQAGGNALLWAARALVVGFELSEATALSLLWSDFNPRCTPVYNQANPTHAKEYEHKVREAVRTPGVKPRGWLLTEYTGDRPITPDEAAKLEESARCLFESIDTEKCEKSLSTVVEHEESADQDHEEDPGDEDWPEHILHPGGLVGDIAEWINQTSFCYQPKFALGAALVVAGVVMGRKIEDITASRTNLYGVGVGHSSSGKDHPADCIERLLDAAGAMHYLGGSRVTSDTAIELALAKSQSLLFVWDEVGHFFGSIKGAKNGSGQHLLTITPILMQLYSSAAKKFRGKQRAIGDPITVDQPNVSIWGMSSPDVLFNGLSSAELKDGFLGRVLLFISRDRPMPVQPERTPIPKSIVDAINKWVTRKMPPASSDRSEYEMLRHTPIRVYETAGASRIYKEEGRKFIKMCHKLDEAGDPTNHLYSKAIQNARRIALIMSASDNFDHPEIQEEHVKWACELTTLLIRDARNAIKKSISDSPLEADKLRMRAVLEKKKEAGMSRSEFTRQTQFLRKKDRNEHLIDLIEAGLVDQYIDPKRPNGYATWLWSHPHGKKAMEKANG
jgi:hypothetical protein